MLAWLWGYRERVSVVGLRLAVMLFALSGCVAFGDSPKPPVSFPFDVAHAGSSATTELRITERKKYTFTLELHFSDQADRNRVAAIAGASTLGPNGERHDGDLISMPIPVRLEVMQIDSSGERTVYNDVGRNHRLLAWGGDAFMLVVGIIDLAPGRYRVSIRSLADVPLLKETPVTFSIGYRGRFG